MDAIKYSLEIGEKQVAELVKKISPNFSSLSVIEQKKSQMNEVIYLYIKNFWSHYRFLAEKIETEKDINFHFYLPLLRTLIEIYGELLYFLNQDERTQIGLFIGNHLLYLSDYYKFTAEGSVPELKKEYERFLLLMNGILVSENIAFPTKINKFSKKVLVTSGFDYPPTEQLFKIEYFEPVSKIAFGCWKKDTASNFYNKYYRTYSDYSHRSFSNQADGHTGTEKYWIIQFLFLISQLLIELWNEKKIGSSLMSEYVELNKKTEKDHGEMLNNWNAKRILKGK